MNKRNTNNCCVDGCRNKQKNSPYSFFKLPNEADRREIWLKKIGRTDLLDRPKLNVASYKVCSVHFDKSVIVEVLTRQLLPGAVPSRHLPDQDESTSNHEGKISFDMSTQTDDSFIQSMSKARNKAKVSVNKEDGAEITEAPEEMPTTSASRKRELSTTSVKIAKKKKTEEVVNKS